MRVERPHNLSLLMQYMSPFMVHHVNIAGEAICPELDEKRKCFARALRRWRPPQQLPQLGDVGGDAPGLTGNAGLVT